MKFRVNLVLMIASLLLVQNLTFGQIIVTAAGTGSGTYSGDGGPATAAALHTPHGITFDASGNLYICDVNNNRIRKVTPAGVISTIAGTGVAGDSPDGAQATATNVYQPFDVVVDAAGNIYYCDQNNSKVKKINTSGIVTTIAGTSAYGFSGDGGPATSASLSKPTGLVFDGSGNLFFADQFNHRIRKISPSGIITTVAGTGSAAYGGDGGPATAASLSFPNFLSLDNSGNVLITDNGNHRIRKLTPAGIITTIVGNGSATFGGDGGQATAASIWYPGEALMDPAGNIYVSDNINNRIRKVTPAGIISTFCGTGSGTYCGDGGAPALACINGPVDVAIDAAGSLYISDLANNRVRKIIMGNSPPYFTAGASASLTICQNATATNISSLLAVSDTNSGQTLTWSLLLAPSHGTASVAYTTTSTGTTVTPTGLTYTPATGYSGTDICSVIISDGLAYDTITINIIITPLPSAGTISGASPLCLGTTAPFTSTVSGGTWSSSPSSIATVGTSSGIVGGAAVGNAVISYTVTNTCGSATDTQMISVTTSASAGTISGPTHVCVGATISLTDPVPGGIWASNPSTIATVTPTGIVGGATAGTAIITYTVTNLCGTATDTQVIVVDPLPATPLITGTNHVCIGSTVSLSGTPTGGVWVSSAPAVASVTAGVVSGISAGTAIISYTVSNICGSSTDTQVMVVFSLPDAGTLAGPSLLCIGGTLSITSTVPGGTWTSSNTSVATVGSGGTIYTTGSGTTTITYSVGPDDNGCFASATYPLTISTDGTLPLTATSANPLCNGQTNGSIALTVSSGSGAYVYAWSNGATTSSISGLAEGPYSVIVSDIVSACKDTLTFNLIAPAALDIDYTVTNDRCKHFEGTITIAGVSGGTPPRTFVWYNGSTANSLTNLAAGTYNITITDANACTSVLHIIVAEDSCGDITIHDVITPNSDGINDTWKIEGLGAYPGSTVELFDKWGNVVFSAKDYTSNFNGGTLPDGTYIYLVTLGNGASLNGQNAFTGTLLIKR